MSSQSEVWVGDIYLEAKMTAEFLRPCINEDTKEQSQSGFLVISRLRELMRKLDIQQG